MPIYQCENFRPVSAPTMTAAAEIFALRKARAIYGRRGVVSTIALDSRRLDGLTGYFRACCGVPAGRDRPGEKIGHTCKITVTTRA